MSTLLEQALNGERLSIDVVDMHGHLGRYAFAIPDLRPQSIVEVMDRIGISRIVVSHIRCISRDVEFGNAEVLAAMRACPGRILGYVALYPFGPKEVADSARRWLAEGFTGLKVHNANGFPYDDAAYEPAYAMADERRLPVLLHTWGQDKEFAQVSALAGRYPQASFLLAHSGCCNEDGYVRVAREHENVYLELAYSGCARGLVDRLVEAAGVEKVVWGSDCNFFSQSHQIGKVLGARIPDAAKEMVLSGNARRILERAR